jgi:L-rhamnose-H+ transport protein
MNVLFGILLIATGAFSAGSFAVPFRKNKRLEWETYWMVYSLGAYIILPLLACLIFTPDFLTIIRSTSGNTIAVVFVLGAVYGVGNLSFGLALRYLGLSLGICPFTWTDACHRYINTSFDRRTIAIDD